MNAREMALAVQLEDATRQCGAMADLLRDIAAWIMHGDAGEWAGLVGRIDGQLAGKVSEPAVPEGWRLVPVEPTKGMLEAALSDVVRETPKGLSMNALSARSRYQAMLAAAPKPQGGEA